MLNRKRKNIRADTMTEQSITNDEIKRRSIKQRAQTVATLILQLATLVNDKHRAKAFEENIKLRNSYNLDRITIKLTVAAIQK